MSLEIAYTKKRHTARWIILILFIGLIAASSWFGYRWYTTGQLPPLPLPLATADTSVDETNVSSLAVSQYTVSSLNPRYINIPSLDVTDTRIYPVNLSANNMLTYASNIHDVGWYQKSNTPGNGGVVLLNGHTKGLSQNGPLLKLSSLKKGDKIMVKRGDGMLFTYAVDDIQTFTTDEFSTTAPSLMNTAPENGKEALNIVVDAGTWIPKQGRFNQRLLVRSSLVDNAH